MFIALRASQNPISAGHTRRMRNVLSTAWVWESKVCKVLSKVKTRHFRSLFCCRVLYSFFKSSSAENMKWELEC